MTSSTPAPAKPASLAVAWAPVMACALAGAAVFQFFGNANRGYIDTASLFYWWGFQWFNEGSETEHGSVVLAVSIGLFVWNLRKRGPELLEPRRPRRAFGDGDVAAPAAAMMAGLVIHWLGFAGQQARVSIIGLLVFAWGVLRLAGGRRWGAAAAFPIAFMLFAIPVSALDTIGFWLRLWVIKASAGIAHAAGIPVISSGTQLVSPDGSYQYDVAAACSGIRSLTAMMALSLQLGYFSFSTWRRRLAVFALCFPLVYVGNVARITAIVFAANIGGQRWGERAHDVMGFGIFVIVLGGVMVGASLIERWWPEPVDGGRGTVGGSEVGAVAPNRPSPTLEERVDVNQRGRLGITAPTCVAALIVLLAIGEMVALRKLASSPLRGGAGVALAPDGRNPVELPTFLGTAWMGEPVPVTSVELAILPPDTGFSRKLYLSHRQPGKHVFLSIVLSGRDRSSIHRPELCLVGQGWTLLAKNGHSFSVAHDSARKLPATVLRLRREVATKTGTEVMPAIVAYWFVSTDAVVATHWERLMRDAWNRVRHQRADRWAYVLMQTDALDGEDAAIARMQAVLDQSLPAFQPAER